MKGIRILAMAVIVMVIASCGTLRNKQKQSSSWKIVEGAKVEQTLTESTGAKTEITEKEVDSGTVVTERETTTTTTREGSKIRVTTKKEDLKPGENFLRDSAGQQVKAILDTHNKTLTIEIETKPERVEKGEKEKITERKDATKERQEEKQDSTNKQVATQAQADRRESSATAESESKPNVWAVFVSKIGWGIAFLVILIGVALRLGFRPSK
ncbi:hypothetical protein [Sphingobacterium sp. UBA6645]|uniref:hypothetical protein n=1 Tax=Sphingobacterium sp. UBA6645 TaxID=1947511 RepID=UPI0026004209|nr:hypothetical protein [Sphingobacterium sp. UBA6645]